MNRFETTEVVTPKSGIAAWFRKMATVSLGAASIITTGEVLATPCNKCSSPNSTAERACLATCTPTGGGTAPKPPRSGGSAPTPPVEAPEIKPIITPPTNKPVCIDGFNLTPCDRVTEEIKGAHTRMCVPAPDAELAFKEFRFKDMTEGEKAIAIKISNGGEDNKITEEEKATFEAAEDKIKDVQQFLAEHPEFNGKIVEWAQGISIMDCSVLVKDVEGNLKLGEIRDELKKMNNKTWTEWFLSKEGIPIWFLALIAGLLGVSLRTLLQMREDGLKRNETLEKIRSGAQERNNVEDQGEIPLPPGV